MGVVTETRFSEGAADLSEFPKPGQSSHFFTYEWYDIAAIYDPVALTGRLDPSC